MSFQNILVVHTLLRYNQTHWKDTEWRDGAKEVEVLNQIGGAIVTWRSLMNGWLTW